MSKFYKVVSTNDLHYGLKTEDIDRKKDITNIFKQVIAYCIKNKPDLFIIGGDIFNAHNPSEEYVAEFIGVLSLLKKYNINTKIMVGNHESIYDIERTSCLSFVTKAKVGFPNIQLIDDIVVEKKFTEDNGETYFMYLPHITSAIIERNKLANPKFKYSTPQEYIDGKTEKVLKQIGRGAHLIVFSHLNVIDAKKGSEELLLKKSNVYLPKILLEKNPMLPIIKVIQYHIHCLDKYCELLTDRGWVKYNEIKLSDKCYGMDQSDLSQNLKELKIKEIIIGDHNGEMYDNNSWNSHGMTPNHRIIFKKNNAKANIFESSEISNTPVKDLVIPIAGFINNRDYDISDCLLKILVWVFSDGGYSRFHGVIDGTKLKFKKDRKKIRFSKILKESGYSNITYKFYEEEKAHLFRFKKCSEIHKICLSILGEKKELPDFFTKLSLRQVKIVLAEMAKSDGCYINGKKKWIQFSTSKKNSADIIQAMCAKNGMKCGMWEKPNMKNPHYIMSINTEKKTLLTNIKKYKKYNYNDKVWCIRNDLGNFLARKNGKVFITGNSHSIVGNLYTVGSPIFCTFGETEKVKYFLDLNVSKSISVEDEVKFIKVNTRKFIAVKVDMMKGTENFYDRDEVIKVIKRLKNKFSVKPVIKFEVTITPENNVYDWNNIKKEFSKKYNCIVKSIEPRIIPKKSSRSPEQKINLNPVDAVKVYLNRTIKDSVRRERILTKAQKYL